MGDVTEPPNRVPLYEEVKRALRAQIAEGRYVAGKPFVSQREVCERFGVSTITAVRALNELTGEGLLVRKRGRGTFVADGPDEEGEPASPAESGGRHRGRRAQPEATIVVCVASSLDSLHVAQVVSGVESVCAELSYTMVLSNSARRPQREEEALERAVQSGASGVVIYPLEGESRYGVFDRLREGGVPIVMVDRYLPDVVADSVTVDNFNIGRDLTRRLIERGHERIMTLWSETQCTSVRDRLAGHIQALREHDLPVLSQFTVLRPYLALSPAKRAARLAELFQLPEPPTAILCANGYVLASAAHELAMLGLMVPDQIELAGMDNAGPYDLLPLAAVAGVLPSVELGRQAMLLLSERIAEGSPCRNPKRLVLRASIRTRDSASSHLRTVSSPAGQQREARQDRVPGVVQSAP